MYFRCTYRVVLTGAHTTSAIDPRAGGVECGHTQARLTNFALLLTFSASLYLTTVATNVSAGVSCGVSKVLIAGDALRAERGSLNGPNPSMTLEMGTVLQSMRSLADLDIDTIVCYHGGVVSEDVNGQLRRVIQEVSGERDE